MSTNLIPNFALRLAAFASILLSQSVVSAEKCGSTLAGVFTSNRNAVALKAGGISENNWVEGLEFSPDSTLLATAVMGSPGYTLWDWRKDKVLREFQGTVPQNGKPPGALQNSLFIDQSSKDPMRFRPDLPVFTACHNSYGEDARGWIISTTWNSDTGQWLGDIHYPGGCESINYLPDGKFLLGVSGKSPVRMMLLNTNANKVQEIWNWQSEKSHVQAVAFSPNRQFVAVGSYDYARRTTEPSPGGIEDVAVSAQIYILDIKTGAVVRSLTPIPGDNRIDGLSR